MDALTSNVAVVTDNHMPDIKNDVTFQVAAKLASLVEHISPF